MKRRRCISLHGRVVHVELETEWWTWLAEISAETGQKQKQFWENARIRHPKDRRVEMAHRVTSVRMGPVWVVLVEAGRQRDAHAGDQADRRHRSSATAGPHAVGDVTTDCRALLS